MANNGFFLNMCHEAQDELAAGNITWRDAPTNVLILAAFGYLFNDLTHKLVKPLWTAAGSVFVAVVGYLLNLFVIG